MITPRTRALLDRYALASRSLSRSSGERLASEAGQSVEFHDFRPYQAGDELRYVDWRVYGRTGRLYTRLYQAERNIALHVVLDTSRSMMTGHKARFARILAQLLSYAAQRDSVSQVHLFDGRQNRPTQGRGRVGEVWNFIEAASAAPADRTPPAQALKTFALTTEFKAGAGLALVISDLLDEASWQPALAALKARGLDAGFLQVMAAEDLDPEPGQLELEDLETGEKLLVGPEEVRAYHRAVHDFIDHTRRAVLRAGFRHTLLKVSDEPDDVLERQAFAELIKAGILVKR